MYCIWRKKRDRIARDHLACLPLYINVLYVVPTCARVNSHTLSLSLSRQQQQNSSFHHPRNDKKRNEMKKAVCLLHEMWDYWGERSKRQTLAFPAWQQSLANLFTFTFTPLIHRSWRIHWFLDNVGFTLN